MTTHLTAKSFRDPLLMVLGELTQYKAGEDVPFEKTYEPIFKRLGITDRTICGATDIGIPWTERWIQFAFKDLCDKGLGARLGRGKWMLTPSGVQASLTLNGATMIAAPAAPPAPVPVPDVTVAPVNPTPAAVPVQAAPVPVTAAGLALVISTANPDPYHEDEYIRGLAAKDHPCLGAYSDQAPTCRGCGIMNGCMNAVSVALSRMAIDLHAEDLRQAGGPVASIQDQTAGLRQVPPNPVSPGVPPPAPNSLNSNNPSLDWVKTAQAQKITAAVPNKCPLCELSLDKGASAVWCHLPGAVKGKGSAMFHESCYENFVGKKVT